MKKIRLFAGLLILWITFLCIGCNSNKYSASGNENKSVQNEKKIVSEKEYKLTLEQSQENVKKVIRRETTDGIVKPVGAEQVKTTIIEEFLPPDKSKRILTETDDKGENKTEIIYIGDVEYRKETDENWTKIVSNKSKSDGNGITVKKQESSNDNKKEFLIEEIKIDGEFYRVLIQKYSNAQGTLFGENKVWINKEGLIVKESFQTSLGRIDNLIESRITKYDYTIEDLKIEAPIK